MPTWFEPLREILESLYFCAGIVIAVAAIFGLRQLKITRDIARTNAQREALKFAAERCQYFAENTVSAYATLRQEYVRLKLTFLSRPLTWRVQKGEILDCNVDTNLLDRETPQVDEAIMRYLNSLEAFAIPFAAGVADDDLGFQETALGFCNLVKEIMPVLFQMRRKRIARYESTVKLFELWNIRLAANLAAVAITPMRQLIESAARDKISAIGTEQK